MTDPSQGRKKERITYTASQEGVERAKDALKRGGFESKINFAKSQIISRNIVTKFFQCQPIQLDSFKRICDALKLNWKEIAGISEEKQSERSKINDCSSPNTNEEMELMQTLRRQVTVIDESSQTIITAIILEGDIDSVPNFKILESILQEYSGKTIKIIDIKKGSIKLIVEGSPEDIKRLVSRTKSRELKEVGGFPIEDIQILSESSGDDDSDELNDKWYLVQEIVSQGAEGRNLRGADLSDADLSGTNLSGANLSGADLSNADLIGADLIGADLSGADLSGADLSGANLRGAKVNDTTRLDNKWRMVWEIVNQGAEGRNLSNANLSNANLIGANLSNANLWFANLSNANLRRADLSGTNLIGANLSNANLWFANLSNADLRRADLSGVNLIGADLSSANLRGAQVNDTTRLDNKWRMVWEIVNQGAEGRNLSNANLSNANLSNANLRRANLRRANLSNANLSNANLSNANLSNANLSNANLRRANLSRANLSEAANVKGARLGSGLGLTDSEKEILKSRGAIFNDSPGDREPVPSPAGR